MLLRCLGGHEFEWSTAHGYVPQPHPERTERLAEAAYRAEFLTARLRESSAARYATLRAALTRLGITVKATHLTEFFPDGQAESWGALVTEDRRVLTFVLTDDGAFTHQDRTTSWDKVPHNLGVQAVLQALDAE